MKQLRIWHGMVFVFLLTGLYYSHADAAKYRVDPVHSSIVFRVKHLDIAYVFGRINNPAGFVLIDDGQPGKNYVEVSVKAQDVDTHNDKRDTHLRSADFFGVVDHPLISFKSTAFEKIGEDTYRVSGEISLHGVTQPLTVTVKQTGAGRDPWGGIRRGFETSFTVKRSTFGMTYLLKGVADEVQITLSIEGLLEPN